MLIALLTAVFFGFSAISGRRATRAVGSFPAILGRQGIAFILLGLYAHTWGGGLQGATLNWFVVSGVIGFGIGDIALFEAYPRIGPSMTILLCQCLAAPIGALTEWVWLGTVMTWTQLAASALVLFGVGLAVSPEHLSDIPRGHRIAGTICGVIAAVGQGWGAVISRYASLQAQATGFKIDGMTAAYQRMWGGVLCLALVLLARGVWSSRNRKPIEPQRGWKRGWIYVLINALTGATLGVSLYQWALITTPSSIVLPIVATTPLVVMFFEWLIDGVRPSRRGILGALLAVIGVAALVTRL